MTQEKMQIDGYAITTLLFRGPYTVLYEGRRHKDSREVFIKIWPTAYIASEREREHIQREIEKLRGLNEHPHMLEIHEIHIEDFGIALVTDAAPLGSLQARFTHMASQPFPQEEAYAIIEQIGSVLSAAHARGITHANLSSQSIFLRREGQAALTDFHMQSIVGTIRVYQDYIEEGVPRCWYMAPEQFRGYADAYSDQYALGCLAYVLLTGRVPFLGNARATLLQKHTTETPIFPSHLNAKLPSRIDEALLRALAKDPSQRFPSIEAFLQALRGEGKQSPIILPSDFAALPTEQTQEFISISASLEDRKALNIQAVSRSRQNTGLLPGVPAIGMRDGRDRKKKLPLICMLVVLVLLIIGGAVIPWLHLFQPVAKQEAQVKVTATIVPTPTSPPTHVPTRIATPTPTPSPTPQPTPTLAPTPTVPVVATQPSKNRAAIVPIFDCVQREGNSYAAYFGYTNSNSFTVNVPQGSKNYLSPGWYNGVQPGVFNPGRQYHVFRVTFKNGVVVWKLDGGSAIASQYGPDC